MPNRKVFEKNVIDNFVRQSESFLKHIEFCMDASHMAFVLGICIFYTRLKLLSQNYWIEISLEK